MKKKLRIAIVGGSIGGLTAGVLLRDAGYDVDIYERSREPLIGYGTGIVVQPEIVRYFLQRTDITLDRISVPSHTMRYLNAETGERIGEVAADWRYTSFNALYDGLLLNFGRERYHLGQFLVGIGQDGDVVDLRFAGGRSERCDLAICADGGFSVARQRLLGIVPKYAGYITWRGTVAREQLSEESWNFFQDRFTYGLLHDGHTIVYPLPILSDDLHVVDTKINFQWYLNVAEGAALEEMMTDRDGIRRPATVHANDIQQRYLDEFRRSARDRIAVKPIADLMNAAENPFISLMADVDIPRMVIGRACLIGDAAIPSRPHAAAGAAKAAANAWALAEALEAANGDVEEALRRWELSQLAMGYAFLAKVRYMASLLQHGQSFLPGDPNCRFGLPSLA